MRGRSYSPSSPPRGGYARRGRSRSRSPSPRGRYGGGGGGGGGCGGGRPRDDPSSLLVRNLRHDCRPEDLRRPFGEFGPLKDIYLPRDYYTGNPRGFGFVQFVDPADAAEAKYQMNGQLFQGRELTVVFAEENRKRPNEMRARERRSRRWSPARYSRSPARHSRSPRDSRSPPPRRARYRSRSRGSYSPSPRRRRYSRSVSPRGRRHSQERSDTPRSRGRSYSQSPSYKSSKSRSPSRSRSATPGSNHAVERYDDRSPSR